MVAAPVVENPSVSVLDAYRTFSDKVQVYQDWVQEKYCTAKELLSGLLSQSSLSDVIPDRVGDFLSQPFIVERTTANDYLVHVPAFLPLHCGWLIRKTRAWTTYRLNVYSVFGTSGLPEWLKPHIDLPNPPDISLDLADDGNYLTARDRSVFQIKEMFPNILHDPDAEGRYKIKGGDEELFLARLHLVRAGLLLQKSFPVDVTKLQDAPASMGTLRPYQDGAWKQFLLYGRVGIFLPPRAGKSFLGLYAAARFAPAKVLVIVPTRILKLLWEEWIREHMLLNITVETYQGAAKGAKDSVADQYFELVIYEEAHTLPASVFRKLACLHYRYSIGLSATPFREDGQEAQIYALTGKPVFCDWSDYFSTIDTIRPRINIIICESSHARTRKVIELADPHAPGRTLIYVDHIKTGDYLSDRLYAPFYHHKNPPPGPDLFTLPVAWQRTEQVIGRRINTVIVSRIGDEGLKIDGLRRVIVAESLGDSRRQEIQRLGRLLANTSESQYYMVLTRKERHKFHKKLDHVLALDGFVIEETLDGNTELTE